MEVLLSNFILTLRQLMQLNFLLDMEQTSTIFKYNLEMGLKNYILQLRVEAEDHQLNGQFPQGNILLKYSIEVVIESIVLLLLQILELNHLISEVAEATIISKPSLKDIESLAFMGVQAAGLTSLDLFLPKPYTIRMQPLSST